MEELQRPSWLKEDEEWTLQDEQKLKIFALEKMAKEGDVEAQVMAAMFHETDEILPKNYEKAYFFYELAAKQENKLAQFALGRALMIGLGVAENQGEAILWLKKASEKGECSADLLLGESYANGLGVEKDGGMAVKYYMKAASMGIFEAEYRMAKCYEEGFGVPQNKEEAEQWMTRAKKNPNYYDLEG